MTPPCACIPLGSLTLWGLEGWRIAFFTVAAVSAAIGLFTLALGRDPGFRNGKRLLRTVNASERPLRQEIWDLMRCPTFVVIIIQVRVKETRDLLCCPAFVMTIVQVL